MEKAPTRDLFWLKALTSAFTIRTLIKIYKKKALSRKHFQPGEGPSRGILHDLREGSFEALVKTEYLCCDTDMTRLWLACSLLLSDCET